MTFLFLWVKFLTEQTQKDLLLCICCRDNVNLWVDFF
nr:MAG TPA: hypothetical protein [Caudoviricetes sp.]